MKININRILTGVFGSRNERILKRYRRLVDQVNACEPAISVLTDAQLRARVQELRANIIAGKVQMDVSVPEAMALMRESMDRNIGIRQVFNPEENFDPESFDADADFDLFGKVEDQLIQTGQAWQNVAIPNQIYEAVRRLYPESRPPFRCRCFDVQIIGGMALYEGRIAEMATGEGKTFVAPLACFLRVIQGWRCHVITVNDYLVRRDANWVRPAFEALGFSVGYIQSEMEPGGDVRRKAYECDVCYGTNSEFGFDFLRDNMKESVDAQVQGPLEFAIVDEVDSILIDEARTPLIISGAARDDAEKFRKADEVARKVIERNKAWDEIQRVEDGAKRAAKAAEGDADKAKDAAGKDAAKKRQAEAEELLAKCGEQKKTLTQYYEVEWDRKSVHLTHEGIEAAQSFAGVGSFYVGDNMEWPHLLEQSLRAHVVYERDKDYVVERGESGNMEVVIVDEYTGRKMVGRQWSEGLHQAIEAKERVTIKEETQTLATITLQNFFRLYKKLSGMTGTAQTEADEFSKIYNLDVVTIPTHRPCIRRDGEDRVYRTAREKWEAILTDIKEAAEGGRPVLVGTTSVEKSEMLSKLLTRKHGIEHEVLNAKQHEREAHIVAKAGLQHKNSFGQMVGNVTIATNMAGRGTDIKLAPEAVKAGGLHVIGTERHTARRIDNQLRGRSARQGDPGSSQFYVSLEDELMKLFAPEWTIKILGYLGMEEGMAIEDRRVSKGIIRAQKKVEENNFNARKHLLEYDEVMEHQRNAFYGMRQRVLRSNGVDRLIWQMIGASITDAVEKFIVEDHASNCVVEWAKTNLDVTIEGADVRSLTDLDDLERFLKKKARSEANSIVSTTLVEFVGDDMDDKSQWDTKNMAAWAMSRFRVNLTQSQIRAMSFTEVQDYLSAEAGKQVDTVDCSHLAHFLEPLFAEKELCQWAKEKFSAELDPVQFFVEGNRRSPKPASDVAVLIGDRARQVYGAREVKYPVDHTMLMAFGPDAVNTDDAYAAEAVRAWALAKFGVDLPLEEVRGLGLDGLAQRLCHLQAEWISGPRLKEEAERLVRENPDMADLVKAVNARFHATVNAAMLDGTYVDDQSKRKDRLPDFEGATTVAERVVRVGRAWIRRELTDLEQYVVTAILDQSWKDHLYAMDILRSGIGLQSMAEKDPRVVFKREGTRFFNEMLEVVRGRVTDLVFRVQVPGRADRKRPTYTVTQTQHDTGGSYGVAESTGAASAPAQRSPDRPAKNEPAQVTQPIVRDKPKVGRNDPCPCGSGLKYKKCHGINED